MMDKGGSDVVRVCEDAQELGDVEQIGRSKPTGRLGTPDRKKNCRAFATPLETRAASKFRIYSIV
jgi:hypothetical protein